MPTFRQIAAPLVVAGLIGGGLTGVLSAQTGSNQIVPAGMSDGVASADRLNSASLQRAPSSPDDLFIEGLSAYRGGDVGHAVSIWEEAADDGHLGAQWNLARLFAGGDGVAHDARRRLHYLEMAAAQHDPDMPPGPRSAVTVEALVELAELYRTGDPEAGLRPQPARAFRLFQHSATLFGNPRAQHYLGLMYLNGEGINRDISQAVRWLFLAARKQYAPSQAALGDYFWERGADAKDRLNGLMWFALASENAKGDESRAAFHDRYEAAITEVGENVRPQVDAMISAWNRRNVTGSAE